MPLSPLDLTLPTDTLRINAWPDAVIDQLGHDARSSYAERFWLPILGPSTYLLLRRISAGFDRDPDGFDLPLLDTATSLGLGNRGGRNAPFLRAIDRTVQFKLCRNDDDRTLAVRRRLPPLTRPQVTRLSAPLRDEHDAWARIALRHPDLDQQRRRARRLALSLAELGEADEDIEHQLHRWHLHPALAHEALRWARARCRDARPAGPGPTTGDPATAPPPPRPRPGQQFDPAGDAA